MPVPAELTTPRPSTFVGTQTVGSVPSIGQVLAVSKMLHFLVHTPSSAPSWPVSSRRYRLTQDSATPPVAHRPELGPPSAFSQMPLQHSAPPLHALPAALQQSGC